MSRNDEGKAKRTDDYPELPARDPPFPCFPLNRAKIDVPPDVARHIDAGSDVDTRCDVWRVSGRLVCQLVEDIREEWDALGQPVRAPNALDDAVRALTTLEHADEGIWVLERRGPGVALTHQGPDTSAVELHRALERAAVYALALALERGWKWHDPEVRWVAPAHVQASGLSMRAYRVQTLALGLIRAVRERGSRVRWRPKSRGAYVKDAANNDQLRPADDYDLASFYEWLRTAAYRHAKALVLEEVPGTEGGRGTEGKAAEAAHGTPPTDALSALIAAEGMGHEEGLWALAEDAMSPRQLKIIAILRECTEAGDDLATAKKAAAEMMGISLATVDVQLHRLREKLKAM